MRRIQLPDCFEARYVVGRSLFLVPVLTFLLFVFWRVHSSWFWLFEIKYVIFVGIGVWMTIDKVESERNSVEKYWSIHSKCTISLPTEFFILTAVGLTVGAIMALVKTDWRWIAVASVLCVLMWLGLVLRSLVYYRWLNKILARVDALQ
jgi:hypothetical protein